MKREMPPETPEQVCVKNLKALRKVLKQNQTEFWYRFGVAQSRGSRFEKGGYIPPSVAILIQLYLEKKVKDTDLLSAIRSSNRPMALESKVRAVLAGYD